MYWGDRRQATKPGFSTGAACGQQEKMCWQVLHSAQQSCNPWPLPRGKQQSPGNVSAPLMSPAANKVNQCL
eukprot:scaffold40063_cov17-Tisochrysis_lutea.AAC.1